MQGEQPTFLLPPPAPLSGHVASALGRWFDPGEGRFAARFEYQQLATEIETTYLLKGTGDRAKLPGTAIPKRLEGNANPFRRQILFFPRLTLYLDRPDWVPAFRSPRYAVNLGRSQDLFTYRQVEVVEMTPAEDAYLERTLLPYDWARRTGKGMVALMPRWIDYAAGRFPHFDRYVILQRRIFMRDLLQFPGTPPPRVWADPTAPRVDGSPLGLVFLRWDAPGQ
jgi:CRISPR-associated protein Cas5t